MNSVALAQSAYSSSNAIAPSERDVEYRAFARITRDLSKLESDAKGDFASLAKALHENRRLWSILARAVASEDNALPEQLRGQIFYLSEFTQAHSRKVLDGDATVAPLVEINTAVMRGLRATVAA